MQVNFEGLILVRVISKLGNVGVFPAVWQSQGRSCDARGTLERGRLFWLLGASFSFARHRGYPEDSMMCSRSPVPAGWAVLTELGAQVQCNLALLCARAGACACLAGGSHTQLCTCVTGKRNLSKNPSKSQCLGRQL